MAKRGMTSADASMKKVSGHINEHDFAELIGGEVNKGSHTDKRDVVDAQHGMHSVKAGQWWQIFLYSEQRLRRDAIFQGLGEIANIMIDCINAYPPDWDDYNADKDAAKERLRPHMRALLAELQKPGLLGAFLNKALFDGGNAEFLSIFPGAAKEDKSKKCFHVFHKDDVTKALLDDLVLENSKARHSGQTPELKVVFRSRTTGKLIGEIEDRRDSKTHYREMKFRLNGPSVFTILKANIQKSEKKSPQVTAYGKAVSKFKIKP